jgi:hypothetical protein
MISKMANLLSHLAGLMLGFNCVLTRYILFVRVWV